MHAVPFILCLRTHREQVFVPSFVFLQVADDIEDVFER